MKIATVPPDARVVVPGTGTLPASRSEIAPPVIGSEKATRTAASGGTCCAPDAGDTERTDGAIESRAVKVVTNGLGITRPASLAGPSGAPFTMSDSSMPLVRSRAGLSVTVVLSDENSGADNGTAVAPSNSVTLAFAPDTVMLPGATGALNVRTTGPRAATLVARSAGETATTRGPVFTSPIAPRSTRCPSLTTAPLTDRTPLLTTSIADNWNDPIGIPRNSKAPVTLVVTCTTPDCRLLCDWNRT